MARMFELALTGVVAWFGYVGARVLSSAGDLSRTIAS
jgi:hypothetical protein